MEPLIIELDFGVFSCRAELFDKDIARSFAEHLPYDVNLMQWGDELYGSIHRDLGKENPVEKIPPGGLAYSQQGAYICIFFGQTPAWPVDHIGSMINDEWTRLKEVSGINSVNIRLFT